MIRATVVRENQTVVLEDLAVGNMAKNRSLARSISDAGWSEFRRQVTYKAKRYGCRAVLVDRFEPSSKRCSSCGEVKAKLRLSERTFRCSCGFAIDRDHNAALNLQAAGLAVSARGLESSGDGPAVVKLPRGKRELNRGSLGAPNLGSREELNMSNQSKIEIGSRWRDNDTRMSRRVVVVVDVTPDYVTIRNGDTSSSYSSGRKTRIQAARFTKAFAPEGGAA